ncbi:isoaspartyl peptidase/L-asparaginase family protein [Qipengyuania qiaonensis]|uniref:Isoaspartyl peptidase/L-asparaginase n=1 Tax=Qipengyuania qiaonensis TaxID=2867240 RepID=A0ABS7JA42_9SPHN|nr:isoaspartyl peptidase/L-asparaginase [Qipengyuania qiaonensis]MBX7483813.1 isoaspartyl peptidase/L-asparaginase [Qipengyuania qiaonensis]
MTANFAIALHGGAGVHPERDYGEVEAHLGELIAECAARLGAGQSALDAVEQAVAELESSGLYVAGRGSAPSTSGEVECDAAIMDGATGKAGGVCALQGLANPISAARKVLDQSPFLLLAGDGARRFALEHGCAPVAEEDGYYRLPVGIDESELSRLDPGLMHGTVGAVAVDGNGRLASATSTGGLLGKQAGRVGDTPITGIGNWADEDVAISCTGIGETFIRAGGARDIVARMAYGEDTLEIASSKMLDTVAALGGDGGLIAMDCRGRCVMPFNSPGMKRAFAHSSGSKLVRIR